MISKELLEYKNYLIEESEKLGIQLSEEQVLQLLEHLNLVIEKNKVINLTRILNAKDAVILHIIDSLLLTNLPIPYEGKFLDIGTGAGFPGIPFGVVTDLNGTLIDSVGKKIVCVNEFIDVLKLNNLTGISTRIEEFALKNEEKYSLIFARAVAQSNIIVEYAAPLQKMNTHLIVAKANITDDEYQNALKAAEICGYENVSRETFELPESFGHREFLIFKKVKPAKIKLPRKNGQAKLHPLGE